MILLLYAKFYIIRSQEVTNILRNGATNGDFRFFAFPGKFCFASITLFLFNTPVVFVVPTLKELCEKCPEATI